MNKRGQTATEYLIILAVVIVIALIVVAVLGGIPGIGGAGTNRASAAYWSSSDNGITSYALSAGQDDLTLTFKNNLRDQITINSVTVGDETVGGVTATYSPG